MTKDDVVDFIVKEYDLGKERVSTAVEAFMKNGIGISLNDASLEVSDVAEYIVSTSKYWEPV